MYIHHSRLPFCEDDSLLLSGSTAVCVVPKTYVKCCNNTPAEKDNRPHFYILMGISIRVGYLLKNMKPSPEKGGRAQKDLFNRDMLKILKPGFNKFYW